MTTPHVIPAQQPGAHSLVWRSRDRAATHHPIRVSTVAWLIASPVLAPRAHDPVAQWGWHQCAACGQHVEQDDLQGRWVTQDGAENPVCPGKPVCPWCGLATGPHDCLAG